MKTNRLAIIFIGAGFLALTSLAQDQKKDTDKSKAAPSPIPGYRNLQEATEKLAHTKSNTAAGNREPTDIDPKAVELKDLGMDLFHKKNRAKEGIEKIEAALKIDPRMPGAYSTLMLYYALGKHDPQTAARYLEEGVRALPEVEFGSF